MKREIKKSIVTYGDFGKLVKRLMKPSMSQIYRWIGVSDQLGNYYLKQSVVNPDKKLSQAIEPEFGGEE